MTPIPINPITNPIVPSFELGTLIGSLMGVAFIIAGILTLLYLALGGLQWIGSGGDKAGMESARGRITNALIGLTITAASWAIITLVTQFLGLPFPCLPIPSLSGTVPTCPTAPVKQTHEQCMTGCQNDGTPFNICLGVCASFK